MRGSLRRVFLLIVGIAAFGAATADESFRCGSKLIVVGMTQQEVLSFCGEPNSRSVEVQDVRSGNQVVGTTTLHRWTYESYSSTRVLVFDQDRLTAIE
jgi:Protein of unknown function (DUF2845)